MSKVLYITARPHDEDGSYSLAVGEAFKEAYLAANPLDEVVVLDLYDMNVPQIDNDVFSGWGKLASGNEFAHLSDSEQQKVGQLNKLVDQFVSGDKYVFVNPLWNFSFPPVMKAYIDAICVSGKTFKYTEQGPVGLLQGHKMLHIQACGGIYSKGPGAESEMGDRYLRIIANFFGIEEFESLFVEGMAAFPDKAQEIKAEAIQRAKEIAKSF